jgi:sirohydrochlorin cobaltochelatase
METASRPEAAAAIVLFGHGSRDPRWTEPFEAMRAAVERQAPGAVVRLAYLEHSPPGLDAAVAALAAEGHRTIALVPLFLGAGAHVRHDIPAQAAEAAARHGVALRVAPFIGDAPAVVDAIARHVVSTVPHGESS